MPKTARQLEREIAEALRARTRDPVGRLSRRPVTPPGQLPRRPGPLPVSSQAARDLKREIQARRSHAAVKKKGAGTKIDLDRLTKLFGLPSWDDVDERNLDYYSEMARGAEDQEAAEQEARDELFHKWHGAVTGAAERLFGEHGLEIEPVGKHDYPYEYKIVPKLNWNDAANKIRETINGVGYFHFGGLKEFLRSGPYTAQQAVLSHLGVISDYPAVYGSTSARSMYDSAMS